MNANTTTKATKTWIETCGSREEAKKTLFWALKHGNTTLAAEIAAELNGAAEIAAELNGAAEIAAELNGAR